MLEKEPPLRHPVSGIRHLQSNRKVGLLGGSFNPAHDGHIHISKEALKRLGLDTVWWLVSPQNPLKSVHDMEDFQKRFDYAAQFARTEKKIVVSDFEQANGTRYTVDTVRALIKKHPRTRFVWLMGADNLAQLHRWNHWRALANLVPIAVFDRTPFSHNALRAPAALALQKYRINDKNAKYLPLTPPPAWTFFHIRLSDESATILRKTLGKRAFMCHTNLDVDAHTTRK